MLSGWEVFTRSANNKFKGVEVRMWVQTRVGIVNVRLCPTCCSMYMGSCQNYGPFLGTLNNRCHIIIRTQKGTIILTTTHIGSCSLLGCGFGVPYTTRQTLKPQEALKSQAPEPKPQVPNPEPRAGSISVLATSFVFCICDRIRTCPRFSILHKWSPEQQTRNPQT